LADKFAFPEATPAVDNDEVCRLRLVTIRELIKFDVPINELLHTISDISGRIEVPILEIAISETSISLLKFTATAERFISP
jgi:hypothetical protein